MRKCVRFVECEWTLRVKAELFRQVAKFVALRTRVEQADLSSSYPYQPLVLISTAQCVAGLRSKRVSANVPPFSLRFADPASATQGCR